MNYREYKAQRQYEFNSLPLFFAFSNEQFDNGMKKLGITDIKDVRAIGGGGFCHKDTIPKLIEFTESDKIGELMKDPEFAEEAIYYEMGNHEYHINTYQGNWDVCSCFGNVEYNEWDDPAEYFKQLGWEPQTIDAYERARKRFLKKELRYLPEGNGRYSEVVRPIFEDGTGENGWYDINVSCDSGTAVIIDITNQFIKQMW